MIFKKKLVSLLTAAACMASVFCVYGQMSDFADENNTVSALTAKTAKEITSEMKIGWNLGNSLDAFDTSLPADASPKKSVTAWGNPEPTQELIDTVKNGGFNTVRIPTTWFQHVTYNETTQTYEVNEKWMAYVKKTVDYAYNNDMFIILNLHHEDWINVDQFTDDTYAKASKMLGDIWSQIAVEFKDYDQHLIFEGMNEPRQLNNPNVAQWGNGSGDNGYTWNYINKLNEVFVNTIRSQGSSANSERLLMLPGYCATSDIDTLNNINIPANSGNVAISVHAYSPYFFTMDTSSYANHQFPGKSGYGEDYEQSLTNLFNTLSSVSNSKNVPIIIGEFSASDFNNTSSRVNWAKSYLSKAKAAGIPCVLWDNNISYNETGEAHGYVYRLTNTWYPNSIDVIKAMMDTVGVTNYTLPEYQEYVAPTFSWDNIEIGNNWQAMYYSESGTSLAGWDNIQIDNWQQYVNDGNMFALVYDSPTIPNLIMQGGWYKVTNDDDLSTDFVAYYTYDEIVKVLEADGQTIDGMTNMFIGASSADATIYGLYAVPVNTPVVPVEITAGDADCNGIVNVYDTVLVKKYILGIKQPSEQSLLNADMNSDGSITVIDLIELNKFLLNKNS